LDTTYIDSLTSDGSIECKGQGPCGIIAVLCVHICSVLVQVVKHGGISVVTIGSIILIAILKEGRVFSLGV